MGLMNIIYVYLHMRLMQRIRCVPNSTVDEKKHLIGLYKWALYGRYNVSVGRYGILGNRLTDDSGYDPNIAITIPLPFPRI